MSNDLNDYDFQLPRELIAQEPLRHRTDSRMMVIERASGRIRHAHVRDLPDFLYEGDALVLNDSKVVRARFMGQRSNTGGRWEGLFLQADENGIAKMMTKTRGKPIVGESISLTDDEGRIAQQIVVVGHDNEGHTYFHFVPEEGRAMDWLELMERCGRVPLPPYIRDGMMVSNDIERYQTVYARAPGSIAAPTAGLHLTEELIKRCRFSGQYVLSVTLHVGIGTFRPIKVDSLDQHQMHFETGVLSEAVANRLNEVKLRDGRIIAVGTTSLRVLESVAGREPTFPIHAWSGETNLFIKPGYTFKLVDGLLTNFHLPKSSLLVLVSALLGNDLRQKCYDTAIEEGYRFYSYGDCMLIL